MKKAGIALLILACALVAYSAAPSLAGTLPNIGGRWYAQGDPTKWCSISQSGTSVTFRNEQGANGSGQFSNPSVVVVDWGYMGGHAVRGKISFDLQRIDWSNGTYWVRAAGPIAPTPRPTPTPTPAPERLHVTYRVEGNAASPIYVSAVSLGNGMGRTFSQCVSFRNISNKEATDVDFSFVVTTYSGKLMADFGWVDRGKFTPPIAIDDHCFTGSLWPDRTVRLMSQATVRVKSVTFADGTTWVPGEPFVRAFGNGGAPIASPASNE